MNAVKSGVNGCYHNLKSAAYVSRNVRDFCNLFLEF